MPPPSFAYLLRRLLGSEHWRRLHVRASLWAALITVLLLLCASWIIVPIETSAPKATITSFPDAVWWSIETATTVGYGDLFPVTAWGRVIATVVMLAGISLFSIVTASIATWFVSGAARRVHQLATVIEKAGHDSRADASDELRQLHSRFDRLEQLITTPGGPPAPRD
ncbi:potassium channel family protein [Streptomyces sp. NPDC051569]|uniref:potassium channel family protein n=1 Tax=Streptomyces sp. NPDC051569 TaxID=3365661 RepID=UPI00379C810A